MQKKTILVIDDNREVVRFIAKNFKEYRPHYSVINAVNGKIGCQVAAQQQPDLIIMDWEMPEMNGIEATRKLKQMEETHNIPIVIATGVMTTSEDLQIALEAGAIDYVRKPIDFIELLARINTALRITEQNEKIRELLKNEIELKKIPV